MQDRRTRISEEHPGLMMNLRDEDTLMGAESEGLAQSGGALLPPEEAGSLGQIRISHSVVASIVRLAALEVEGVCAVGSSLVDGIAEIFSRRESDRGVRVTEDEAGRYIIEIHVILRFGVELAQVAMKVQQNVSTLVGRMTMKAVGRVDVMIDGIRLQDAPAGTAARGERQPLLPEGPLVVS